MKFSDLQERVRSLESQLQRLLDERDELTERLEALDASKSELEALRAENARLRDERSALLDRRDQGERQIEHLRDELLRADALCAHKMSRIYRLLTDDGQGRTLEQVAADTVAQLRAAEGRARQAQMQMRNKRKQDDRHAWRRYFAALVASGLVLQQSSDRADENVQEASDLADKMLKLERERFDREEP